MTRPPAVSASVRSGARRAITAGVAAVLVLGAASTSRTTDAAWTDATSFAAAASAGTWATQPPATPANSVIVPDSPTTSINAINWEITTAPGNLDFCVSLTITGATSQPAPWELRADLDLPPFNGMDVGDVYYQGDTQVTLRAAPGDPRTLVITGKGQASEPWNPKWNNVLLDSSRTLPVKLCVGSAPVPPQGSPAWYTTSVRQGEWTDTRACKVLSVIGRVTDTAANPFYFGWTATLDLTDAKARIAQRRTVNEVSWDPNPSNGYQFSTSPGVNKPVPDSYTITSGRMTVIKGTQRATVTACVTGY